MGKFSRTNNEYTQDWEGEVKPSNVEDAYQYQVAMDSWTLDKLLQKEQQLKNEELRIEKRQAKLNEAIERFSLYGHKAVTGVDYE